MKTASLCNKRNPTNANAQKLKKVQRELINIYQKEQKEYIQSQINKIQNSVQDRQSWISWQTVSEESKKKSTSRGKLKAACQEEQIQMWKKHFMNLLGNFPNVTDKPVMKIINNKLDTKLRQFTLEELNVVLQKLKTEKLLVSMKYPQKYGRPRNSMTYCFDTAMPYITRTQSRNGKKAVSPTSPRMLTLKSSRTTKG